MPRKAAPPAIKTTVLHGKSIGVIGLGQIGGSIIRRLTAYRPAITVYGLDTNTRIAGRVRRYCRWSATIEDMVRAVDLIVLSIPVPAILETLPLIAQAVESTHSRPVLVTDTGTLKHPIQRAAGEYTAQFAYAGIHPLCGSERIGWDAARGDLFIDQTIICCGREQNAATRAMVELIACLGGKLVLLDAEAHDRHVALTIGLPHVLAYVANVAAQHVEPDPSLVSGSWQSLVRVTASDPDMVAGFLTGNYSEQRRVIAEFRRQLTRFEEAMELAQVEGKSLTDYLSRANTPHRS